MNRSIVATLRRCITTLAFAAFGLLASALPVQAAAPLAAEELQELAADAYVYAYPMVLMEVTRQVATNQSAKPGGMFAPMNQFAHVAEFPDANFDAVVRANADTLYSSLWFDVSREPLLIKVPDSAGRYYLLPALDMWTDVFTSPGTRTTGNGAQILAIVGRDWKGKLPAGVQIYRSPTSVGWILGRTQTNGIADYAAVRKFQAGIKAIPLSAWGKPNYVPPAAKRDPSIDLSAPVEQVAKMDAVRFFGLFTQALRNNPPHDNDHPMLDRLARLGLVAGKDFELSKLSPEAQAAIARAPGLGQAKIAAAFRQVGNVTNGWRMILNGIGTYGTDYTRRAVVAYFGLGANAVEDAIYPTGIIDAAGKLFDSAARYVVHFDKDQLPPTRAFWSLTMYNNRQFFAANPINRFAIGDRDALNFNADGSLDIYIQREAPEADKQSNWLPAPANGNFSMNLRLYWPKPTVLAGDWVPPPVKKQAVAN